MTEMTRLYGLIGESLSQKWFETLYHSSDGVFFPHGVNQSRFANPISYHMDKASNDVIAWLFSDEENAAFPESIEDVCRIKVIQDLPKADALESISQLGDIVEEAFRMQGEAYGQYPCLASRVQALQSYISDRYDFYKDELERIRLEELKRQDVIPALRARRAQRRKEGSEE